MHPGSAGNGTPARQNGAEAVPVPTSLLKEFRAHTSSATTVVLPVQMKSQFQKLVIFGLLQTQLGHYNCLKMCQKPYLSYYLKATSRQTG